MADENKETQEEEIEVLESIYADDFRMLSEHQPFKFEVSLRPEDDDKKHLVVQFLIPRLYPESTPTISVYNRSRFTQHDCKELLKFLEEQKEDFAGEVMCYNLTSDAKDWIEERVKSDGEVEEEEGDQLNRFMDENEFLGSKKKLFGTAVNRQSFQTWQKGFDQEMEEKKKGTMKKRRWPGILTGKELFMKKHENLMMSINQKTKIMEEEEEEEVTIFDENLFVD